VLVGEPAPAPEGAGEHRGTPGRGPGRVALPARVTRPAPFHRLWQLLHPDPRRLGSRWCVRDGRLACRLRPVAPEQERWVEVERVADRPDVELRIVAPPRQEPQLSEIVFPPTVSFAEAKLYVYQELQEPSVQPGGAVAQWREEEGHVLLSLGCTPEEAAEVPLEPGICEVVAVRRGSPGREPREGVPGVTCAIRFERSAGWDRDRAERWVEERLGLRDAGRTVLLCTPHRSQPALARQLAELFAGACAPAPAIWEAGLADGTEEALAFVPVPGPSRGEHGRPGERRSLVEAHLGGGATATVARQRTVRGGAGLEIDLTDPQAGRLIPADLRGELPAQGVVNLSEARAVVQALEALVRDDDFRTASSRWAEQGAPPRCPRCDGPPPGPAVAVLALFPAQARLLGLLVQRSAVVAGSGVAVEVGVPADLAQRECFAALVSLTRSHTHRAVPFTDHPQALLQALTRPVARLVVFGDPGTLARRSQWHGALDHLDESAGRLEQALITTLAGLAGAGAARAQPAQEPSGV
jgi:hypothetical protein